MWDKRNKTLVIILAVLLIILGIDQLTYEHNQNKAFKDKLLSFDSSKVAQILIYPKNQTVNKIQLVKQNNQWFVVDSTGKHPADMDKINKIFDLLLHLRPTQVLGNDKKAWKQYGVTDTSATHIVLKNNKNKEIAHLYTGEIKPSEARYHTSPEVATYVRVKGDKNVYLIPHLLATTFVLVPQMYYNNNLTPTLSPQVKKIELSTPDTSFVISNKYGHWYINGKKADSLNCERYVRLLEKVESQNFASADSAKKYKPYAQVKIHYTDNSQITIKALGDTTARYIWSSYNPQMYFKADILYNRIFKPIDYFVQKPKKQ